MVSTRLVAKEVKCLLDRGSESLSAEALLCVQIIYLHPNSAFPFSFCQRKRDPIPSFIVWIQSTSYQPLLSLTSFPIGSITKLKKMSTPSSIHSLPISLSALFFFLLYNSCLQNLTSPFISLLQSGSSCHHDRKILLTF